MKRRPHKHIMPSLELKIHPPVVALGFAAVMWLLAISLPLFTFFPPWRLHLGGGIALLGGLFALAGAIAFRKLRTTVNPLKPAQSSAVVTAGVYKITRNPMYVGLVLVLLGWAIYLGAPLTLLGPIGFAMYVQRFQIIPEERVLLAKFGDQYSAYMAKVRRWL